MISVTNDCMASCEGWDKRQPFYINRDQLEKEFVPDMDDDQKTPYYLLHHAVICQGKETMKVRVVYDV